MKTNRGKEWVIKNNGEIIYPYATAKHKGINRRCFRNAIDELQEKGFLDIAEYGSGGYNRKETKYFIDDRWKAYGTPGFKPPKKPRQKDTRSGRGWESIMSDPVRKQQILMKRKKTLMNKKNRLQCQK
ncbi:hypothetical protein DSCW_07660 [Desulfosarcina widdelii]|uniref:Uncharacterized protein n=1 Tax=Desulfosarcina widdelii TaxID=947919 RepID=A0A5K7YZC8_9BACT|nr:hypothetical protein [Desulfosarcina widdelii]BBO73349.1 hypothetical protein DSCW_07660 [Desulfosarcina widdelii]